MSERVLIVDDSKANRLMLSQLVKARGCVVVEADSGKGAIDIVTCQAIDLILLDIRMPGMDGFEVLEFLKLREEMRHIPVIVVTALDDLNAAVRCISMGAEDYLMKPYEPTLLGARLRACLEKKQVLQELIELKQDLQRRNDELEGLNRRLETMAFSDTLTGLPNRRFAVQELGAHWASALRQDRPLSCIMVDLDYFKKYNDNFGHDTGDEIIRYAAEVLRKTARVSDYACRFGGEEFLVICPDTDAKGGAEFAERIVAAISAGQVVYGENTHKVTASLGLAQREPWMQNWNDLILAADQALYEAKRSGRNCHRAFDPSMAHHDEVTLAKISASLG